MGMYLLKMFSLNPIYETHFINRGKHYWDNEVSKINNVHYTYGNRDDGVDYVRVSNDLQWIAA